MSTRRALPLIVSGTLLVVFLIVTKEHGLGVSHDSIFYARAAQSLLDDGMLQVPITWWDTEARYQPLSRWPPLLSITLALFSGLFDTDPIAAGRLLNAICIFFTSFMLLSLTSRTLCSFCLMAAFLLGETFLIAYLWLFSEPLFFFLIVLSFWVGLSAVNKETDYWSFVFLALLCGLATLTRYAGIFLWPAYIGLVFLQNKTWGIKAKQAVIYSGVYLAVLTPWLIYQSAVGGLHRTLGIFMDGFWEDIRGDMIPTIIHWILPKWLPGELEVPIFMAGCIVFLMTVVWNFRRPQYFNLSAFSALALFLVYLATILLARAADPEIPLNYRTLAPAYIYLALGLAYFSESIVKERHSVVAGVVITILASYLVLHNARSSVPRLIHAAEHGRGYATEVWSQSETLSWLRTLPTNVTIFSNVPDAICSYLPVAAKFTPRLDEISKLAEFENRVKETAPSVVVLFDDWHNWDEPWLVSRDALINFLPKDNVTKFRDGIAISWDNSPHN